MHLISNHIFTPESPKDSTKVYSNFSLKQKLLKIFTSNNIFSKACISISTTNPELTECRKALVCLPLCPNNTSITSWVGFPYEHPAKFKVSRRMAPPNCHKMCCILFPPQNSLLSCTIMARGMPLKL